MNSASWSSQGLVLLLASTAGIVSVVLGPWSALDNAGVGLLALLVFVAPGVGTLWMLWSCIRYERRPLPFVLLAFVPYAFLWYYFERVEPSIQDRRAGPR